MNSLRQKVNELLHRRTALIRQVKAERQAYEEAKQSFADAKQAQEVVQQVAEEVQNRANQKIASVVTRCLEAMGFDYEFRITFTRKRGKTEADLHFYQNGYSVDPMGGSAGGCLDIASFALRIACLVLARPQRRLLCVLDEPCRHLKPAEHYGPLMVELMEKLSDELGIQFIVIQNLPDFQAGKVVQI